MDWCITKNALYCDEMECNGGDCNVKSWESNGEGNPIMNHQSEMLNGIVTLGKWNVTYEMWNGFVNGKIGCVTCGN